MLSAKNDRCGSLIFTKKSHKIRELQKRKKEGSMYIIALDWTSGMSKSTYHLTRVVRVEYGYYAIIVVLHKFAYFQCTQPKRRSLQIHCGGYNSAVEN